MRRACRDPVLSQIPLVQRQQRPQVRPRRMPAQKDALRISVAKRLPSAGLESGPGLAGLRY